VFPAAVGHGQNDRQRAFDVVTGHLPSDFFGNIALITTLILTAPATDR